ncbi:hypothetical protein B0H14DRAFT_3676568 [Mycena olivaceomarginata]|nr:hypothetical protein B0H14DRAFT_3676568 [Mycena olivaceomarginata]
MFVVLPRTVISNTTIVSPPDSALPATTPAHMSLPVPAIVPPAPQINATVVSAPAGEIFQSGDSGKEDPGEAPSVGNADESTPVQDAETLTSPPSTGSVEEPRYHRVQPVPPLKQTKFPVPQAERRRIQIAQATAARANILASALTAIDKLIASKKIVFHAGNASLQSYPDHEHHAVDQTRTSPAASSSSTEQVEDLILWDPRVPSSTGTTPTSSPTPTPLRAKGPTLHSSRYSESVARARAISDVRILDVCWDGLFSGQFETSPSSHLAFPKPGVPTHWVLQPYDEKFYPRCLTRTFQELKFLGTDIGQALQALNSTFGVTCDVLAEIIDDCSTCMGCKCRFSRDGFNDHIRAGLCGNRPTPSTIAHVPRPERLPHDLAIRELPPGKQLGTSAEFLDSPIGAVLMEWNSRLGVPLDVWALASTATTECSTCHLCRTFPAHAAHLHTVTGVCNDLVDEAAGAE